MALNFGSIIKAPSIPQITQTVNKVAASVGLPPNPIGELLNPQPAAPEVQQPANPYSDIATAGNSDVGPTAATQTPVNVPDYSGQFGEALTNVQQSLADMAAFAASTQNYPTFPNSSGIGSGQPIQVQTGPLGTSPYSLKGDANYRTNY